MKIIHFADFHLGVESSGPVDSETGMSERVLDYLDVLDSLVEFSEDEGVDIVLFAGDAFHKPNPNATYLREFSKRMNRLSKLCPVVLLVGNHDVPSTVNRASSLDVFQSLDVPNIHIGNDYKVHTIETKSGLIEVATVPYPIKSRLGNIDVKEFMSSKIKELKENLSGDNVAVLLGHFSVDCSIYGSEREMMIGQDAEVSIVDLVDECWNYVALGHIHCHQYLSAYAEDVVDGYVPPIVYSGSLERVSFSEEKEDKGFVFIDTDLDYVEWEFVNVDAREYMTIEIDVRKYEKLLTKKIIRNLESYEIEDKVIRLRIKLTSSQSERVNIPRLYEYMSERSVYHIHSISKILDSEERKFRLELDNPIESYNRDELLEMYFTNVEKLSKKETRNLIEISKEFMIDE